MPNWCDNELRVYGPKKELDAFVEAVKGNGKHGDEDETPLDFHKIIPYPDEYLKLDEAVEKARKEWNALTQEEREQVKKEGNDPEVWKMKDGFNSGGYEWCTKHWGTKWDACEVRFERKKNNLVYLFDTAWSPPRPIVEKLITRFPKLKFKLKYFEGGNGFQGVLAGEGGDITEDMEGDYRGCRGG